MTVNSILIAYPITAILKAYSQDTSDQQVRFVMSRIEFIFSRFKSIPLGASGEGFRKQTNEGKSLFTLRGLVSCDANKTSSELPLYFSALLIEILNKKMQCDVIRHSMME